MAVKTIVFNQGEGMRSGDEGINQPGSHMGSNLTHQLINPCNTSLMAGQRILTFRKTFGQEREIHPRLC